MCEIFNNHLDIKQELGVWGVVYQSSWRVSPCLICPMDRLRLFVHSHFLSPLGSYSAMYFANFCLKKRVKAACFKVLVLSRVSLIDIAVSGDTVLLRFPRTKKGV